MRLFGFWRVAIELDARWSGARRRCADRM